LADHPTTIPSTHLQLRSRRPFLSNRIGRRPKYRLTPNAALMSSVPHSPKDCEQRVGILQGGQRRRRIHDLLDADKSWSKENTELNWSRQAISVPANLNPKNATSCLQAQCPRVYRNRDRVPDSRPHIASGRSNSIDWQWVASRRHSKASIHLRILQSASSSTTRYGTG
jgi:hypothetical protein